MMLSKIMEKLVCKYVLEDMKAKMDPSQFAGQKGLSCDHYLVKMWHRILECLDRNDKGEKTAIIVSLDWADAFPRVQHTLGVQASGRHFASASDLLALTVALARKLAFKRMSIRKWFFLMKASLSVCRALPIILDFS